MEYEIILQNTLSKSYFVTSCHAFKDSILTFYTSTPFDSVYFIKWRNHSLSF